VEITIQLKKVKKLTTQAIFIKALCPVTERVEVLPSACLALGGLFAIEYTSLVHQIHAIATEKIGFQLQLAWENSPH
jgi:hypothetical protein